MGIFTNLFKTKIANVIYASAARATPWNREAYEQELVRALVDCIASHAAKAEAMHVVVDHDDRIKDIKRNSPYAKLLNQQPNPIMSGYDLKYKLVAQLVDKTTAMCWIKWDGVRPECMLPIPAENSTFYRVTSGGYAVQFYDHDGVQRVLPLEDMVVLRRMYNISEVSGDGNAPIYQTLDMIKASDEGLQEALSVSNKIRGLLKQKKAILNPNDVKDATKRFTDRYNEAAKEGGIVGIDAMEEYTPLNITAWAANAAQMQQIRDRVLQYFRVSADILTSNYTDSQMQAFYESVIEPILIAMGQAFTNACFTQAERDKGNRIIFCSDMLVNMSTQSKTQLISVSKEIGLFTVNEMRALFGYHPIENGDVAQVSLNFVKATDQSKYQTGEDDELENGGNVTNEQN